MWEGAPKPWLFALLKFMLNHELNRWSVPLTADANGPRFYFTPWPSDSRRVVLLTSAGLRRIKNSYDYFSGFHSVNEAKKAAEIISFSDALYKLTRGPLRPTLAFPLDNKGVFNPRSEELENLFGRTSLRVMHALGAKHFPVAASEELIQRRHLQPGDHYTEIEGGNGAHAYFMLVNCIGRMKFSPANLWRQQTRHDDALAPPKEAASMLFTYAAFLDRHAATGRSRAALFDEHLREEPQRPDRYINPFPTSLFATAMRLRIAKFLGPLDEILAGDAEKGAPRLAIALQARGAPYLPEWDLHTITHDTFTLASVREHKAWVKARDYPQP
jgi:hypothetical protein